MYIPNYVNKSLWEDIPEILEETYGIIYTHIRSQRNNDITYSDSTINDILKALEKTTLMWLVDDINIYKSSLEYIDLMLDSRETQMMKVLPYLLTAYFLKYRSNKIMRANNEIYNNESNGIEIKAYDEIFENKGPINGDLRSNYINNVESLTKKFFLCNMEKSKVAEKHQKEIRDMENDVVKLGHSMKLAKTLKNVHAFCCCVLACKDFEDVDFTMSLYLFQYSTFALSVFPIRENFLSIFEKINKESIINFSEAYIDNFSSALINQYYGKSQSAYKRKEFEGYVCDEADNDGDIDNGVDPYFPFKLMRDTRILSEEDYESHIKFLEDKRTSKIE